MDFSKVEQIAYLGPQASFSEMAADIFCGKYKISAYPNPQKTIRQVIEFVDTNPNTLGVIPLENSIEGSVREALDHLMITINPNIRILAQTIMPIKHCLLSRTTEFYSITGVISHPQALAQCQNFIHDEMPMNLNLIEAASTAEAARSLANYNLTYAAIGSEKTAEVYNLNILRENINDDVKNKKKSDIPTNDEIANAVKTLAKAGLNPFAGMNAGYSNPQMMQMSMLLNDNNGYGYNYNNMNMLPVLLMNQNSEQQLPTDLIQTMMMNQMSPAL